MNFDYVIVGAGAAGCALASRLSENPSINVLLLEAGSRSWATHLARIPRALPAVLRSGLLTSYATQPLAETGQPDYWVRGRGFGGSTLVNGMMHLRGEPAGYDDLASLVGERWGFSAFEAAYDEIERRFIRPSLTPLSGLDQVILDSFGSAGLEVVDDVNAATGPRAGATPASIVGGRRTSAAAFLELALPRNNLHVLGGTTVQSLVWQGHRVTGVLTRRRGEVRQIHARTVVLCAGTVETPLLLERSGVGAAELLRSVGIEVRVESPNVGERVREQRGLGLQVRLSGALADALELGSVQAIAGQAMRYLISRGGALARPAYDVTALVSSASDCGQPGSPGAHASSSPTTRHADIQVMAAPFALAPGDVLRPASYPGVVLSGYPIRPTTLSSIHINPSDPAGAPVIDARYAATDADQHTQSRTLQALRRLAYGGPLGDLITKEDHAGVGSPGSAIYHAVGSAAMGPSNDAVVDPELRVRGTEGLRIADLSVLPFHLSGGTAAPAMALGWLAGSLLTNEHDAS